MSNSTTVPISDPSPKTARLFAALGEPTRLALVAKLGEGSRCSIAQLTAGGALTRQAVSKHLRVLEKARVVRSVRRGRETLYALDPHPLADARSWIDAVSRQWDDALARLKSFVEG
jgi:DNA-binding transcriptional ArsR family regulator